MATDVSSGCGIGTTVDKVENDNGLVFSIWL
jgi:hypothetical protein